MKINNGAIVFGAATGLITYGITQNPVKTAFAVGVSMVVSIVLNLFF